MAATHDVHQLVATAGRGFEGEPEEAAEAFAEDAVFQDNADEEPLIGRDAILDHFLAFGARRERFELGQVLVDGDRAAAAFAVRFRSDAHAYAQRGVVLLELRDGLIAAWRAVWVETEEDLSAWAGD